MKKIILIIIIASIWGPVTKIHAQVDAVGLWMNPGTRDFAAIRQSVEQYYEGRDKGRGSGFVQWKRWEYLNERRLGPGGTITNWAARNFQAFIDYEASFQNTDNPMATYGDWTSLGPTTYSDGAGWNGGLGRVNCIAFHPTLANTIWIGCPAGGLWKTTNGGSTWTPLTDGMPNIGVSGIAVHPTNPNIMYILTGDGDGRNTPSIGVLKTVNGGITWYSTGLNFTESDTSGGYKLLIHPTNPEILFAATSSGIYKTTNGGVTWANVKTGYFHDIEFKPNNPSVIYISSGVYNYKSEDTGDTWTGLTGMNFFCSRIALGVTSANSNYLYGLQGPASAAGFFKGLMLSTNSGSTWTDMSQTPNILGYEIDGSDGLDQSRYDLAIAVSRTDPTKILAGGINIWASSNSGTTWTIKSLWNDSAGVVGYTHADIHALEINPLNNYLYCGSDGGFFRTTDFGNNWTDLSAGLAITQFYRIAGTESTQDLLIGGTQDNGSNKWTGGANMLHILGADGMDCIIDFTNSSTMFYSLQNGEIYKSLTGGTTYQRIFSAAGHSASAAWITPMLMDPTNRNILYLGCNEIHKSINGGTTWTNLIGSNGKGAMAMGTNNPNRIYAAAQWGIQRSDNGGTNWAYLSGLPSGNDYIITYLTVNPDNADQVYVSYGGYVGGTKVYRSLNAGVTWTNISGTLPNVPVNCIVFEDNNGSPAGAVYVGTDIGVFYRDNNLNQWIPFRNGIPCVPVFDLEINYTAGVITAGTFGRGLWRSTLYSACATSYNLTGANDPSNPNYTGFQYYEASNYITSSRDISGGIGTDVTYKAGSYVKLTTGFHGEEGNLFKGILGPCMASKSTVVKKTVTGTYAGKLME
jgi:photosystem II stability/assembly factor-like uncharacterized protein